MLIVIAGLIVYLISLWHVRIRLEGEEEITIPYGADYTDPGAEAEFEGDYTGIFDHEVDVESSGDVDTSEVGTYTIHYSAGSGPYHADSERVVHVEDVTPPEIELADAPEMIVLGEQWEDSYTAHDDRDGDLTAAVQVDGAVDSARAGTYTLTYTVTDEAGNTATAERTVIVRDEAEPVQGSKIVFLTFDDGPGDYTEELLDILKAHGAKATFFVTGMYQSYSPLIAREYEEGHTVAVHTYTHNYSKIYASQAAYWEDFEAMNDIIEQYTGQRANIFRFPGGSSNTVSNFNPGVMTRLSQDAEDRGLQYFDWNVDSNDAGGTTTSDGIYENITRDVANLDAQGYDVMVILCHDTHDYTVHAMDRVLTWFEENGYTLLPLQKGITSCHHGIAN